MIRAAMKETSLVLFGGDEGWQSSDWVASDDRVRGGKSESHLDCSGKTARFYGTLDIKTLGGAGFASQRTTGDDREWDLSKYAGITLHIAKGDKKRYTFILKDEILPPDPKSGREQSTVSYECDFELPPQDIPDKSHDKSIFIPWAALNATYRGKIKKDARPIDKQKIKRMSIMMRSFFGTQDGDFSLTIQSISAAPKAPSPDHPASGGDTTIDMGKDAQWLAESRQLESQELKPTVDRNDHSCRNCRNSRWEKFSKFAIVFVAGLLAGYWIAFFETSNRH